MSAPIDCPICMDCIESTTKNCVTTECGHCFHTNCLMQSVAHNGFGCPYCRSVMAEVPDEDSEYDENEEENDMFNDDELRGFRFFWNNINGESHDEIDEIDENDMQRVYDALLTAANQRQIDPTVPSINFVAQKLRDQGVTFEQFVHMYCNFEHMEFSEQESAERFNDELFGKVRIIVSNFTPEQAATPIQEQPVSTPSQQQESEPKLEVDFEAQPKTRQVRSIPRFMVHI